MAAKGKAAAWLRFAVGVGILAGLGWCGVGLTRLLLRENRAVVEEKQRQGQIVREVLPLIGECKRIGDVPISRRGKCLVWDLGSNSAWNHLPAVFRAKSSDNQITVFLVQPRRKVVVGHYSVSGEPAYQQVADVCVVYWPQKKAVGMHSVMGAEPARARPVNASPGYGSIDPSLDMWIESLKRGD